MTQLAVESGSREVVVDLTSHCVAFVENQGDGLLNVFVPHATAGLALVETGSGTEDDLLAALELVLPHDKRWQHRHGSPGHGRDHVLPAFITPSLTVPVVDGTLAMGEWQSICLVDTNIDNHSRSVRLSFMGS